MKPESKSNIKKQIIILAVSICIYVLYAFLLRNQVANLFHGVSSIRNYYLSLIVSTIFGICVFYSIVTAMFLLYRKDPIFLSYAKQFLSYFIPLFIILLLTWPGIFKGDEFYVLQAIRDYSFSPAQTGLTSLFFISCLRFIPSMASIPFFQIVIISCIYAYVFKNLKDLNPDCNYILCRIVLFLFPVLDACLFTLRATLVSFLFLAILMTYYFMYKNGTYKVAQIVAIVILTGLVIAWRTEFIYMLVLLPLFFFLTFKKMINKKRLYITTFSMFLGIICCFQIFNIPNKFALNGSNKYPISLVINPLGNIFALDEIKGEHAYDDIMVINELIDVQALRIHPSVRNISQYWNIPDQLPKEQLDAFMSASYDLILHNFDRFLYYRLLTFAHTNGLYKDEINHPTAPSAETIYTMIYYDENYRLSYYYMNSIFGESIRNGIIDVLSCRHYDNENTQTTVLYPVLYNCIPTFIIALICMFICICKKHYTMAGILFLSGTQVALIFLTAPAMFFMYYICFYISGYFLSALTYYELKK